jgi:molybdopterin synthase catalytic subunit
MTLTVRVQCDDFVLADEYQQLSEGSQSGAVVTFVGKVRDMNLDSKVIGLTLEHYPGMTEKCLTDIGSQALARWPLQHVTIIHRVGELVLGDQIVMVGVSSQHRSAAFEASQFIMDILKTSAPFWKKERTSSQQRWLDVRDQDLLLAKRW